MNSKQIFETSENQKGRLSSTTFVVLGSRVFIPPDAACTEMQTSLRYLLTTSLRNDPKQCRVVLCEKLPIKHSEMDVS